MQKKDFITTIEKQSFLLSESMPFPLPIKFKNMSEQNFSIQEIKEHIAKHQWLADKFQHLWNEEISGVTLVLVCPGKTALAPIDLRKNRHGFEFKNGLVKDLIYEMAVYHRNERIKWEQLLPAGSDPIVGKQKI